MQALGHSVEVSDLYAMRFFPAMTEADFVCERANPDTLNVGAERAAAPNAYRFHLETLDQRPPLFFHPDSDFVPDHRLKPGVLARSGFQRNVPG